MICVLGAVATLPHLSSVVAADVRTRNFIVHASTPQLARAVAQSAEKYRHDLAVYWLGGPLQAWPNPCPIRVVAGANLPAQGVTTYNPVPARDFQMEVVGSSERIMDSVLPHEITHTVLATYFGRPLPRWADEGICTTVEHTTERSKHEKKLLEFLRSRRGIAMNQLFLMKEYPADVLPMYAQGYSVCQFLIDQKGPREFIRFLGNYLRHPSWTKNIKQHYGYDSLQEFQDYWIAWVASGSGPSNAFVKRSTQPDPGRVTQVSGIQETRSGNSKGETKVSNTVYLRDEPEAIARSKSENEDQSVYNLVKSTALPASRPKQAVDLLSLPNAKPITESRFSPITQLQPISQGAASEPGAVSEPGNPTMRFSDAKKVRPISWDQAVSPRSDQPRGARASEPLLIIQPTNKSPESLSPAVKSSNGNEKPR